MQPLFSPAFKAMETPVQMQSRRHSHYAERKEHVKQVHTITSGNGQDTTQGTSQQDGCAVRCRQLPCQQHDRPYSFCTKTYTVTHIMTQASTHAHLLSSLVQRLAHQSCSSCVCGARGPHNLALPSGLQKTHKPAFTDTMNIHCALHEAVDEHCQQQCQCLHKKQPIAGHLCAVLLHQAAAAAAQRTPPLWL